MAAREAMLQSTKWAERNIVKSEKPGEGRVGGFMVRLRLAWDGSTLFLLVFCALVGKERRANGGRRSKYIFGVNDLTFLHFFLKTPTHFILFYFFSPRGSGSKLLLTSLL
jgi:hypothetical protein